MSVLKDLANAVVAKLNAGEFSLPFTAARAYVPVATLEELAMMRVTVVPKSLTISPLTRAKDTHSYAVDVGVQQRVDTSATDDTDALASLVEEIADLLRRSRLPDFPAARWVSVENDPIYDWERLKERQVFTSVLTVTYEVDR